MQVDIWYARTADAAARAQVLSDYRALLSDDERQLEQRYRPPEMRLTHVVTRALARTVLSQYVNVSPQELQFEFGPHGKPSLRYPHVAGLSFNLSHSTGAVVCAISHDGEVGVDIERCDRRVNVALAERYFAPSEVSQLTALDVHEQPRCFLDFWTLKESFIKALGTGLSTSLSSFAFQLTPPTPQLTLHDAALGDGGQWSFAQFHLENEYIGGVAIHGPARAPLRLNIQRWQG